MERDLKPVEWLGTSLDDIRRLPADAKSEAGHQIERVQAGKVPLDFKPMPAVGSGVFEIRVHTKLEHRVFYVARFVEAVYVLHVFEKKTQKTSPRDLDLGRRRYQDLISKRGRR